MKILFAIITCHRYNYKQYSNKDHPNCVSDFRQNLIRKTWKQDTLNKVDCFFFYGKSELEKQPLSDEIFLDCLDDYYSLPKKMQAVFKWALDHGYDYVIKIDDDSFVNVDYLLNSDIYNRDYTGRLIDQGFYKYVSGFTYGVNKKSMEYIINADLKSDEQYQKDFVHSNMEFAEDKWHGYVLGKNNIKITHDPRFVACTCPVCWTAEVKSNFFAANINPKFELMEILYKEKNNEL